MNAKTERVKLVPCCTLIRWLSFTVLLSYRPLESTRSWRRYSAWVVSLCVRLSSFIHYNQATRTNNNNNNATLSARVSLIQESDGCEALIYVVIEDVMTCMCISLSINVRVFTVNLNSHMPPRLLFWLTWSRQRFEIVTEDWLYSASAHI